MGVWETRLEIRRDTPGDHRNADVLHRIGPGLVASGPYEREIRLIFEMFGLLRHRNPRIIRVVHHYCRHDEGIGDCRPVLHEL